MISSTARIFLVVNNIFAAVKAAIGNICLWIFIGENNGI